MARVSSAAGAAVLEPEELGSRVGWVVGLWAALPQTVGSSLHPSCSLMEFICSHHSLRLKC